MRTRLVGPRGAALVLLVGVALAGCASGPAAPSPELLQKIATARTPTDHEALVAYYLNEAASARAIAERHRKMANSYQGNLAGGRGLADMPRHCNRLVESYEGIAAEYDGMAATHRQMAE